MGWVALSSAVLFYAYQFALRIFPSVLSHELMSSFHVDAATFGILASFYYYGYAFFQVPAGTLIDRFGTRRVLLLSIAGCIVGNLCFLFPYLWLACVGRLLIGIGSAGSFLGCIKIATEYFDEEKLSLLTGLSVFVGTMGAVGGSSPIVYISQQFGWQEAIYTFGLLGALLFAFSLYALKKPTSLGREKEVPLLSSLKMLFSNSQTWIIGSFGILAYVPMAAFCDLWGPPFLQKAFGLDAGEAAFAASSLYIGLGAGAPLAALVLARIHSYRFCFMGCVTTSFVLFTTLLFSHNLTFVMLVPLIIALGVCLSPQVLAFPLVCTINPPSMSATASGLHNTICMLSGIFAQPLVGKLIVHHAHANVLSASSYRFGLMLVPVSLMLAIVLSFFIKEPHEETLRA